MANEVIVTTLLGNQGDPVEYIISDASAGANVPKGSVMALTTSPGTIEVATAGQLIVGIMSAEHKGGEGTTKVSVLTHFIGEIVAGTGATTVGYPQKANGTNTFIDADDDTIGNKMEACCISLETVADTFSGAALFNIG